MAHNLLLEDVAANAEADAIAVLANNGYLRIYGGAVLLAELRFGASAFAAAAAGVIAAAAITPEDAALDTGNADSYRVYKSDGTTLLWTGTVGAAGCDLNLNSVAIQVGASVQVTALTLTVPKSA